MLAGMGTIRFLRRGTLLKMLGAVNIEYKELTAEIQDAARMFL
jgi:hypothetical protein